MQSSLRYETKPFTPFGVELHPHDSADLFSLDAAWIARTTIDQRLLLLRGFESLAQQDFVKFAQRLGDLLEWNFGYVLDLRIHSEPKNYLFTEGNVPYHWDGAFAKVVPRFQVFQCLEASGEGGETTFCDTTALLAQAAPEDVKLWSGISISYQTDKKAHYGGSIKQALIGSHPITGAPTIRFAEPLNEESIKLNPLFVEIEGYTSTEQEEFLASFIPRLYKAPFYHEHRWQKGDLLVTDNHALLHGRTSINKNIDRHLQRIHVI
jgi:alpha-ketoglutarate-dependent taurine dioxygenase